MSTLNIDEFFSDVARVLLSAHRSFPQPSIIEVDDICGPEDTDEYGLHSPRHRACFATLLWLADEGYLRFNEQIRETGIDGVVLTARALLLLTRPHPALVASDGEPRSIAQERSSLIYALAQAVRDKSSFATSTVVLDLMNQMHG